MKIALDANVLVRIITGDNEEMLAKSKNLLKKCAPKEIFIPYGFVLETFHVLPKVYCFSEVVALNAVEDILKVE